MSHANGAATDHHGNIVGYFLYNGTVDCCWTALFDSQEAAWDAHDVNPYRPSSGLRAECACNGPLTPVDLSTDYGHGLGWDGDVCLVCRAIVTGITPQRHLECDDAFERERQLQYRKRGKHEHRPD